MLELEKLLLKKNLKIYSIGNPGDLTYPYEVIGNDTSTIKEIVSDSHKISEEIKRSKNPMIIIGESALYEKKGIYILESLKNYLIIFLFSTN